MTDHDVLTDDTAPAPTAEDPPATRKRRPGRPRKSSASTSTTSTAAGKPGRPSRNDTLERQIRERVEVLFGSAALGLCGGDQTRYNAPGSLSRDAVIVMEQAALLAQCAMRVADSSPAFRKALEAAIKNTDQLGLVGALIFAIVLPIMGNHGMIPAGPLTSLAGNVTPMTPEPETPSSTSPNGSHVHIA
jgi:hypothetical protein